MTPVPLPKYKLSNDVCNLLNISEGSCLYRHQVMKGFMNYAHNKNLIHGGKILKTDLVLNQILKFEECTDVNIGTFQVLIYQNVLKGNEEV
jgi:hypothetical protein